MDLFSPQSAVKSLQRCVEENNSKRLEKLLHRKSSLRLGTNDLSLTLRDAIQQGKHDCVAPLLAAGADANFTTEEDGRPALHLLLELSGHPPTIKTLIQGGANPNRPSSTSSAQTPLHIAARRGHQVCVRALLMGGAQLDKADGQGNSAMMQAAKAGHASTVGMLLREGADVNWRNVSQETPLHLAASYGHAECIAELVNAGANPDARDSSGQTSLLLACRGGRLEAVEQLLDVHCDVNAQDSRDGRTVLHWAVQHGDLALVQVLLHRGAEPNVRDNEWETPFMTALNVGKIDVITQLIKAGCRVTITDRSFNTALHLAARDGHQDIIPLLIEAGLDVNLKGAGGLTPLMLGCLGGHTAVVQTLLEHGANPDLLDRHRASALICAILSSATEQNTLAIVKMLIRANCSLDRQANASQFSRSQQLKMERFNLEDRLYSALELAFMRRRVVAFMLLLQAGCKLRHLDLESILKTSANENLQGVDLKTCHYMIKCFKHERYDIKPLKELCRHQTLSSLHGREKSASIDLLPISEQMKRYLAYEDLDHLEETFKMAFKDRKSKTENSTPMRESSNNSQFSRQDQRRQTFHIGSRRISTPTQSSTLPKPRRTSDSCRSTPTQSPSASPSPFKRTNSLRLPRSSIRRSPSNQSVSSVSSVNSVNSPTSPTPKTLPSKSPKLSRQSEGPLRRDSVRRRFGSPDTGYSSACSSIADWTATNGNGIAARNGESSPPGPMSRWSTQDDVFADEQMHDLSPNKNSKIPVFKAPTPRGSRDDIHSASRIPAPNFTRSRSFRR